MNVVDMAGGYLCFVVSILCIGIVTAIIGDVASHFGCTLGIKDSVTAIVFVALGTSIPGIYFHRKLDKKNRNSKSSIKHLRSSEMHIEIHIVKSVFMSLH